MDREDDSANADLHKELEQLVRKALQKVWDSAAGDQSNDLTMPEWIALCHMCGVNSKDFEKGKR